MGLINNLKMQKLNKMSLKQIELKYGQTILQDEILRRSKINLNEVKDYYQNYASFTLTFNPQENELNYAPIVQKIAETLHISILEVLTFNTIGQLSLKDASTLLSNDLSWLDNPLIVSKVPSSFLVDVLVKNNLINEYSNLLLNLDINTLQALFQRDDLDFQKIPNLNALIQKAKLAPFSQLFTDLKQKVLANNDIKTISEVVNNADDININLIVKLKEELSHSQFVALLNTNERIAKEIKEKDFYELISFLQEDDITVLLEGNFGKNLQDNYLQILMQHLDFSKEWEVLINSNEIYQKLRNKYNNHSYMILVFHDILKREEIIFNNLGKSLFIDDFLKTQVLLNDRKDKELADEIFAYILNDENLLAKYGASYLFGYYPLDNYFLKNPQLSPANLTNLANVLINNPDMMSKIDFYLEKYPELIEIIIKNGELNNFIEKLNFEENFNYGFRILAEYPALAKEFLKNPQVFTIINKVSAPDILRNLDNFLELQKEFMQSKLFLDYIMQDKLKILEFLPLLKKYNIDNKEVLESQTNFDKIAAVQPELSLGNTSLLPEFLESDFQNTLGLNYLKGILSYDSIANKIVVDSYHKGTLPKLRAWLDFLCKNISENYRMLNFYILAYPSMMELADDILINENIITREDLKLLELVIGNKNLYGIKSLKELREYQNIKLKSILNKDQLENADVLELFLDVSSLKNGVPWNLNVRFLEHPWEYIAYRYRNVLSSEELAYLKEVKEIISKNSPKEEVIAFLDECLKQNLHFSARDIMSKINAQKKEELNAELLDLEEVRKEASYDNPEASIYIKEEDGIEYIYLNNYDYKCLATRFHYNKSKDNATFSHVIKDYEQYRIFGEKLKDKLKDKNLSTQKISDLMCQDPESWLLVDGISTISSSIASTRTDYEGYAWGKNSNLDVLGVCNQDASISHQIRALSPDNPYNYEKGMVIRTLYGHSSGELWFDRKNSSNERIKPEFIMHSFQNGGMNLEEEKKAALFYHCPIIVNKVNSIELEKRLDLEERKHFLETFDTTKINNIIFNYQNKDENEKVNFLLNALKDAYQKGILASQDYYAKLEDLKWYFYELGRENVKERISEIMTSLDINEVESRGNLRKGYINFWLLIITLLSILAFRIAVKLVLK